MRLVFFFLICSFLYASPNQTLHEKLSKLVGKYEYSILVEGNSVGKQTIHLYKQGADTLVMETEIEMNISYLLFFSYSHKHKTKEVWRLGNLEEIEGETDDNGNKFSLKLKWNGNHLVGSGPEGKLKVSQPFSTNNAWNLGLTYSVLTPVPVMNPETGKITNFQVQKLPSERLFVDGKEMTCEHLQFENRSWKFWFSPLGILVKQEDLLEGYKVEILLKKISR